jgi:hypothetical protein
MRNYAIAWLLVRSAGIGSRHMVCGVAFAVRQPAS